MRGINSFMKKEEKSFDLAEQKQLMVDLYEQGRLLKTINRMAVVLLAAGNEEDFKQMLLDGMELIGQCLKADLVQIWANELIKDTLHFVLQYRWMSEAGKNAFPVEIGTAIPYSARWKELFLQGKNVHGPIKELPPEDQAQIGHLGFTSTITIPLFYRDKFWGIFSVDDCIKERYFSNNEVDILNSVGLMLLNAINRNKSDTETRLQLTKLDLVVKATKIGLWEMEVIYNDPLNPKNAFFWSDEFRHMLGFENEYDFPNQTSSWSSRLHPVDKVKTLLALKNHLLDKTGKTPYDVEYRLKKKNGEYAYYHSSGETIRNEAGTPLRIAGSLMDITETKTIILDTERQRIEAESASKAKSAFLSTMSHEIRTPMNAILGITEILLHKDTLDREISEGLEKIYISGDMLLGIINDILDLSKIEAGKLELIISRYETASLISDTAQLNMMRIGSKLIEFGLEIDENLHMDLLGDELRVKQILNNILSNAFKYTNRGMVKMSVSSKQSQDDEEIIVLIVSITDTGQGMTNEQVKALFDDYSRFNQEANRSTEGTGLGMGITRNLISMMNGEIAVESEPGKGSVFTVFLPQGKVTSDVVGPEIAKNLHNFRSSSRAQMKRIQITRDPMPYGSVLVVDDVETNIFVAKGLMAPYQLRFDSADSGFEALDKIKSGNEYDIVFMDHMMPKMDGVETTGKMRELGYERPIVALTANAVAGQADIFLKNGFDDFISKPIDIRQLNTILNKLIRDKHLPEVVERARRRAGVIQTNLPPEIDTSRFAEAFARDALKSLTALRKFMSNSDNIGDDDIRTYMIHTHGMKSALANIGMMELSSIALKLEQIGRDNDIEAIISETPHFLDLLQECVDKLRPEEADTDIEATYEDKAFLAGKLDMIKSASEEFNDSIIEDALKELRSKKWPKQANDLFDKLSETLLHSDFDEIIKIVSSFELR